MANNRHANLTVQYQSLYLHCNVGICLQDSSVEAISEYLRGSFSDYVVNTESLRQCKAVYIKCHMPNKARHGLLGRTQVQTECRDSAVMHFLVALRQSIFSLLPSLVECTFELANTQFGVAFLQLCIDSPQNSEREAMRNYCSEQAITLRLSLLWELLVHCTKSMIDNTTSKAKMIMPLLFFKNLHIDCTIRMPKSIDKFRSMLLQAVESSVAVNHISIDWNAAEVQKEGYWQCIQEILLTHGFAAYQFWHFAKPLALSLYLQSIYALQSYLGINLGKVPEAAISWQEGNNTAYSQLGIAECKNKPKGKNREKPAGGPSKQASKVSNVIQWQPIDRVEELEFRIMQAKDSVYLHIPPYLSTQLALKYQAKEELTQYAKQSPIETTKQDLEAQLYARGFEKIDNSTLLQQRLPQALGMQGNVYKHRSGLHCGLGYGY